MDAISQILPAIGSGVKTIGSADMPVWQKLLGLGAGGAGTIGNILAGNKRNQPLQQQLDVQKSLMNMTPEQLSTGAAALQRPLSAGLTSGVGNAVQAYLAERGLSQSPGIASEALAQGLAPYQLQEQQLAMQAYLQKLGLPAAAAARFLPTPGSVDLSKIFQSLFQKRDPLSPNPNQPFGTNGTGIANQPTLAQLNPLGDMTGPNDPSTTGDYNFGGLTDPNQFNMVNYAMSGGT